MSRCIIHIGMHKTGTTSIQHSLNGLNGSEFVYFPDPKGQANHGWAVFKLLGTRGADRTGPEKNFTNRRTPRDEGNKIKHILEDTILSLQGRTLLISGEGLIFLSADELCELRRCFERLNVAVTIVAYIRPPAGYLTSMAQQRLKGGSRLRIDLENDYCNYQKTFSKFDAVFGIENVKLWKFEPKAFTSGCVVLDFCHRLGIDLPPEQVVRRNESLSREAAGLLYLYRKIDVDGLTSRRSEGLGQWALVAQISKIGTTKFRLSPELLIPVLENHRADIEWMETRLGVSLAEDLSERQSIDIRDESDLVQTSPETLNALKGLLGANVPAGVAGKTPDEVAHLVHALSEMMKKASVSNSKKAKKRKTINADRPDHIKIVKISDLIEQLRGVHPEIMDGIASSSARVLVQSALQLITDSLTAMEDGIVDFSDFGTFRVRRAVLDEEGNSLSPRQVLYRQAESVAENKQSKSLDRNESDLSGRFIERKPERCCILHIGMRKTATTSIQYSLNGLNDENYIYADILGQPNHGSALYSLVARNPQKLPFHKKTQRTESEIENYIKLVRGAIENTVAHADGRTVLFSGEACSYLFTKNELRQLRDYLLKYFMNIRVVGYIRPPAAYMTSNFQERTKDAANEVDLSRDYFSYQKKLLIIDEVFGVENVDFWKFDPKSLHRGCGVLDFCSRLGIDFPEEKAVRFNESLTREAVGLLYTYRKYGSDYGARKMTGPQNKVLVDKVSRLGKTRFRFSPELIKPVLDEHRADFEWMERRLGEPLYEDLGALLPDDVRDERDLLQTSAETVAGLLALLGPLVPKGVKGNSPEEVALLVHALRGRRSPI